MAQTGSFRITYEDGKGYAQYYEKDGRYYVLIGTWWEKGGYIVPSGVRRISKKEYMSTLEQYKQMRENSNEI